MEPAETLLRNKGKKYIIIRKHYAKSDPQCIFDYFDVEVLLAPDVVLRTYGDYYHDKGDIAAAAFVDGLMAAMPNVSVKHERVADRDG